MAALAIVSPIPHVVKKRKHRSQSPRSRLGSPARNNRGPRVRLNAQEREALRAIERVHLCLQGAEQAPMERRDGDPSLTVGDDRQSTRSLLCECDDQALDDIQAKYDAIQAQYGQHLPAICVKLRRRIRKLDKQAVSCKKRGTRQRLCNQRDELTLLLWDVEPLTVR